MAWPTVPVNWIASGLELRTANAVYTDLWNAMDERWRASHTSQANIDALRSAPDPSVADAVELLPGASTWRALSADMALLASKFVNHTDTGGDWNGLASALVAPVWGTPTTALPALAAHIGETEVVMSVDGAGTTRLETVKAWAIQTYKFLNLMVWTVRSGGSTATHVSSRTGSASTYAAAVTAFNAAAWGADTAGGAEPAHDVDHRFAGTVAIARRRSKYSISLGGRPALVDHENTIYATMGKLGLFENNDFVVGDLAGDTTLARSYESPAPVAGTEATGYVGNIATVTNTDPGVGFRNDWKMVAAKTVFRWDVTGGFTYLD